MTRSVANDSTTASGMAEVQIADSAFLAEVLT